MIKMYFRVEFGEAFLVDAFDYGGFTNEEEAVEYATDMCNNYLRRDYVTFRVVKYYEFSKD